MLTRQEVDEAMDAFFKREYFSGLRLTCEQGQNFNFFDLKFDGKYVFYWDSNDNLQIRISNAWGFLTISDLSMLIDSLNRKIPHINIYLSYDPYTPRIVIDNRALYLLGMITIDQKEFIQLSPQKISAFSKFIDKINSK